MMNVRNPVLDDDELSVTRKALSIHRQAMMSKLDRIEGSNRSERDRTLAEIEAAASAAAKIEAAELSRAMARSDAKAS